MKTLLLIDAYAMIYRAYYAFIRVPRINSRGENTSAIYGFLLTLDDLIKRINPTHIGVAFDPHGNTFRHDAYELYKAQREAQPEEIRLAVPYIKDILAARRISVLEVEGYEADDVIGTLAKKGQAAGFEVYMATPDKDYGQLVDEHIFMYRPRHNGGFEKMGVAEVCAKYGIARPSQVIDLLGLMGDSSDNIPGCKGVGEKTAITLLQQFGDIETLLANTDQLKGSVQNKVQTQAEAIRFSRFLATICTDVPIALDEDSLLVQSPDEAALQRIYERLEFRSLLQKAKSTAPAPEPRAKETKRRAAPVEQTLDLFSAPETPQERIETTQTTEEQDIQTVSPTEEGVIASYLLNPEVAYNPNIPLKDLLRQLQADPELWKLYQEVELPLVAVLRDMEQAGVRIDCQKLKEAEEKLTLEANQLEQSIYEMADYVFNINSPKQVGELLFEHLKLDSKAKKSSRGQYSTSEEVLQGLRDRHPVVGAILDYRELKKLISTYVAALPTYINPSTGKIHTTYHQTTTATGRLSSSNPNLQNLPIRSERGRLIREAVIADEGCVFLSADYSQIELRLLAHLSQDEHLLHAFRTGQDIHVWTASKIYNVALSEVTSEQRRRAKTANFGIIYGISAFGLAQQLGCSRTEAKQLIDDYFVAFPGVKTYIASQKAFAREHGYAVTLFGRKRYLPGMVSENATVRSFAERNAVNAPTQGTAADIIKRAMVRIHRRLQEEHLHTQMIMQVHDELNFNVPVAEAEHVRELVVYEMEHAAELSIPLVAACGIGQNWLEAH
ncbi:MAG: DNA polymerase I [Paludibacteraceae bacterium]